MMYAFIRCWALLLSLDAVYSNVINFNIQDEDRFGPYDINYTKFNVCMGPKSNNLTELSVGISTKGLISYGNINITFLAPTLLDEGKLVVYSLKNGKIKDVLWTYKINNLCNHFSFATVIHTYLKAHNCIVNKGTFTVTLDFEKINSSFFGTAFFYGEYLIKVTVFTKKGNIACFNVGLVFMKKTVLKN